MFFNWYFVLTYVKWFSSSFFTFWLTTKIRSLDFVFFSRLKPFPLTFWQKTILLICPTDKLRKLWHCIEIRFLTLNSRCRKCKWTITSTMRRKWYFAVQKLVSLSCWKYILRMNQEHPKKNAQLNIHFLNKLILSIIQAIFISLYGLFFILHLEVSQEI